MRAVVYDQYGPPDVPHIADVERPIPNDHEARSRALENTESLNRFKRRSTGLCFIVFPAVWVFAFASHPGLLEPQLFLEPAALIRRAHGNALLQFAHALVAINTGLMIVVALHFMKRLEGTAAAWLGVLGAALATFGACMLAADKGALCLTMSAIDTLPESTFEQTVPALLAIFSFKGWVALVWGLLCLPSGVLLQTIGLWRTRALHRWQAGLLAVGVLFIGFPDGAEIINLTAALLMAAALVPYGARLVTTR